MKEKTMRLARIKIPQDFKDSLPRPHKINAKYYYYYCHGEFEKPVTIDKHRVLVDGYITYLLAKMLGKKKLTVVVQES